MARGFAWLLGLGVVAAVVAIALGVTLTDPIVAVAAGVALSLLGLIVAAESGAFRATLVVRRDALECRRLFGLSRTTITRPETLESGGWVSRVPSALVRDDELNVHEEAKTGSYLRVGHLRVGGRRSGPSLSRWDPDGLVRGPRRRAVDVALSREALLTLEWALAVEGWLTPAPASAEEG